MKAVSFRQHLPIDDPASLIDVEVSKPKLEPRDLLVQVQAISVNPVDTKIRKGSGPGSPSGELKILGWDAAGVVMEVGSEASLFKVGDAVYYAGSVDRPGAYAEYQAVDERIVGRKPSTLDFAAAAALPLTTITAWEMLFDRLKLSKGKLGEQGSLLIIAGAGGVGSIAIQLARRVAGLTVIATASRPESEKWCYDMGAHQVIDHRNPLPAQLSKIAPKGINYVLPLTRTEDYFEQLVECMAEESAMVLIENVARPVDINKLKPKNIALHWEFMFGRARPNSPHMEEQGRLLNEVSALVDNGLIRSTARDNIGAINATNLRRAHALVESGKSVGKVVLSGF